MDDRFEKLKKYNFWGDNMPTTGFIRNEYADKIYSYRGNIPLAADFELMLRLFEKYNIKTKYIDYTTIRMRLGGATSKNWTNIKKQNFECVKAFNINGFKAPTLYPIYRLIPKLLQYIK